jgi:uncharacterized protein (DUF2141 family)
MKNLLIACTTTVMAFITPAMAQAELPGVTVNISNLSPTSGTVEVSLFNSAVSFLAEPYLQESGKVNEDGTFQARFAALPSGEYAVVVVHDANDNGQLDNGFLGFGGEDYAYSNNVQKWFGRPDFDQVRFVVEATGVVIEINMN